MLMGFRVGHLCVVFVGVVFILATSSDVHKDDDCDDQQNENGQTAHNDPDQLVLLNLCCRV